MKILDCSLIRDKIISTLLAVNTTTASYDLSGGLSKRVVAVSSKDLAIDPLMITEYPHISVRIVSKEETQEQFGGGKTDNMIKVNAEIFCVYDDGSKTATETNLFRMVCNVEANLKNDLTLGGFNTLGSQVMNIIPRFADFNNTLGPASPYNRSAKIETDFFIQQTES